MTTVKEVRRRFVAPVVSACLLASGPTVGHVTDAAARNMNLVARTTQHPAHLSVHVSLGRTVIRMGEHIRVRYWWTDGNGQLVDTNDTGTMAIKVLVNVPCRLSTSVPHPSQGHGSWLYTAIPTFVGPLHPTARVFVGFNVRTGGCAPVEDRTAGRWVTVEPAQAASE